MARRKKRASADEAAFIRPADMLRVLAHPHRLRIIEFLDELSEAPVHEIQDHWGLQQSSTSTYLTKMRRTGILRTERRGKEVLYRVADSNALTVLDCIRNEA